MGWDATSGSLPGSSSPSRIVRPACAKLVIATTAVRRRRVTLTCAARSLVSLRCARARRLDDVAGDVLRGSRRQQDVNLKAVVMTENETDKRGLVGGRGLDTRDHHPRPVFHVCLYFGSVMPTLCRSSR